MIGSIKIILIKVADSHWNILSMPELHIIFSISLKTGQSKPNPGNQTQNQA